MTNRFMIIALLIFSIGGISVIAWDNTIAVNTWNVTIDGNQKCNESILSQECEMLENKDLEGMYKGLTLIERQDG